MEYDRDKVDEVTLALLYLVMHDVNEYGASAWKGFDRVLLTRSRLALSEGLED
jgi:hypothetical protein